METITSFNQASQRRTAELLQEQRQSLYRRTDRLFAWLMLAQWLCGIAAALWISPRAWAGVSSSVHIHVWAAVGLGGAISLFPGLMALLRPGEALTRYSIAVGEMLTSALLIHLTGGRIETHFHVFGALAFLAFYRDWRVLIPATLVVAADHMIRGIFWPMSVFGVLTASRWRWVEHAGWVAGWVLFEDLFLVISCLRSSAEMRELAERQASLEGVNETIERTVRERTDELGTPVGERPRPGEVAGEREGEGDRGVEVGAADVADRVDPEHDHQPECDRYAHMTERVRLRIDHDRAAPGEDEREGADRLRGQRAQQLAVHAAAGSGRATRAAIWLRTPSTRA